jgi:CRISPR/Cas system-associated exonuclease Cas4 (RecB family)
MMPYTYRMSHVGTCPRALSAERLGLKSEALPAWLESSANEGKKHEEWIIEELQADDIAVTGRQMELVYRITDNIGLLGHIDGIVNNHSDTKQLLEIKTMSQYEFDRWMRGGWSEFPQYATQLTCYMEALGIYKALYVVKNRNNGFIDKKEIVGTPEPMEAIVAELIEVEKCVAEGKLFPAEYDPVNTNCKRCRYKQHCLEIVNVSEQEMPALSLAVINWRKGKLLEIEAKEFVDGAEEVFEQHSIAINKMKWKFENLVISLSENKAKPYYKKEILESTLTTEQLEPALMFTKVWKKYALRITDQEK